MREIVWKSVFVRFFCFGLVKFIFSFIKERGVFFVVGRGGFY